MGKVDVRGSQTLFRSGSQTLSARHGVARASTVGLEVLGKLEALEKLEKLESLALRRTEPR